MTTSAELTQSLIYPLVGLCFCAAAIYASVGHGGASAYLAVMALFGMGQEEMKPIALSLNVAVSGLAFFSFWKAGYFRTTLFWPLVLSSVPAAFVGGWLSCSVPVFNIILALALIFGAWRLVFAGRDEDLSEEQPKVGVCLLLGMVIGFLSGLVGIGGGIFLTPLLIFFGWASPKHAAAISAAFICVNSIAGLSGFVSKGGAVPGFTLLLLPAVLVGAWFGALWGSRRASSPALEQALAVVLIVAAAKFVII